MPLFLSGILLGRSARGTARTTGLIVAVGVGLACAGLVAVVVLRGPRSAASRQPGERGPDPASDQSQGLSLPSSPDGKQTSGEGGWGLRVELADRSNAARRAALITARRVEPQEGKRFRVTEPAAWIFFSDGRALRISAASGLFHMPARDQAPERGSFEGNVRGDLFADSSAANAASTSAPKPAASAELGDTLEFDATLGEVRIPGAVAIDASSQGWMFEGKGVHVLLDQPNEGLRRLTVAQSPRIRRLSLPPDVTNSTDKTAEPVPSETRPKPIETLYQAEFAMPVTFTSASQTMTAEQAGAFVRLLGNRLRPGAIATMSAGPARTTSGETSTPAKANAEPVLDSFELSSNGSLDIVAAQTLPQELAQDDVHISLSGSTSPVSFNDSKSGLAGSAGRAVFAATRGDLVLSGVGAGSVSLRTAGGGALASNHLALNIPTGVGQVRGEGSISDRARRPEEAVSTPDAGLRTLTWKEQADFVIDRRGRSSNQDSGTGSGLAEALVAGSVEGFDGTSSFGGDVLRIRFAERSQPLRAELVGNALARDSKDGALSAGSMVLDFEKLPPDAASPGRIRTEPRFLSAQTFVEARRPDSLLSAESLDATIGRPASGKLGPLTVIARGTVNFTNTDRVVAQGHELRVDVPAERANVIGLTDEQPAIVSQGGSSLTGTVINLDRIRERVDVPGPGRFETSGDESTGVSAAKASWQTAMTFDSTTGILDAKGETKARVLSNDRTIESVDADSIRIELTPSPKNAAGQAAAPERRVIRATATADASSPKPAAVVESRQYDGPVSLENTQSRRAERILHLTGTHIVADNQAGTISVPGAGKAVAFDRRSNDATPEAGLPVPSPVSPVTPTPGGPVSRGTTLMEWTGSMLFTRDAGVLSLKDKARLTHERAQDGLILDLEAATLDATIATIPGQPGESEARGELRTASAIGSVFGRVKPANGERQIAADSLVYDAEAGSLRLSAVQGITPREITIFDAATSGTLRAAEALWDLRTDRIEIIKPSPITTPR